MALPPPTALYAVLGVAPEATAAELKAAYRSLVKRHHPDVGGDPDRILALNAAWAVLGDREKRRRYDAECVICGSGPAGGRTGRGRRGTPRSSALSAWLQHVYAPIDRLIGQVINPFPAQLRALSADPYDDDLMATFCAFLEASKAKLEKVVGLYRSMACPSAAGAVGLSLYHCFSRVQDALAEFERYTLGYVDSYLHDGREMLREARQQRSQLHQERKGLEP